MFCSRQSCCEEGEEEESDRGISVQSTQNQLSATFWEAIIIWLQFQIELQIVGLQNRFLCNGVCVLPKTTSESHIQWQRATTAAVPIVGCRLVLIKNNIYIIIKWFRSKKQKSMHCDTMRVVIFTTKILNVNVWRDDCPFIATSSNSCCTHKQPTHGSAIRKPQSSRNFIGYTKKVLHRIIWVWRVSFLFFRQCSVKLVHSNVSPNWWAQNLSIDIWNRT